MALVTGLTAEAMAAIRDGVVIDGHVDDDGNLILTTQGGDEIDAGNVKGDPGNDGEPGSDGSDASIPSGSISIFPGMTPPVGYLICDGSAISRSTYSSLFGICNPIIGNFTITIASPGVVTLTAHGLFTGQQVYLTTTGALPTGLSVNTAYFVIRVDANTFRLATTLANAVATVPVPINTTGSQSGTHTIRTSYGVGDGSTTFNLPNLKGRVVVGVDSSQTEFDSLGETGGEKTHLLITAEIPSHTHGDARIASTESIWGSSSIANRAANTAGIGANTTGATGGGGPHNNLQPYISLNYIIKT